MPENYFVGLSAGSHDPAIAIVSSSGKVHFAEAAERWLGKKRANGFSPVDFDFVPRVCAEIINGHEFYVGFNWSNIVFDYLKNAVNENQLPSGQTHNKQHPFPDPVALTYSSFAAVAQSSFTLASNKQIGSFKGLHKFEHHLCHAKYAAKVFGDVVGKLLVIDHMGEGTSCSLFSSNRGRVDFEENLGTPNAWHPQSSLGFLYSLVCALCGYNPLLGEEWKVMGLAPFGKVDSQVYNFLSKIMYIDKGHIVKGPEERSFLQIQNEFKTKFPSIDSKDIAATGQKYFENCAMAVFEGVAKSGFDGDLIVTGGCALNTKMNGILSANSMFKNVFIPPCPSDDGTALGAAFLLREMYCEHPENDESKFDPFLGSEISESKVDCIAKYWPASVKKFSDTNLAALHIAEILSKNSVVGIARGKAEFGPRALGNRSILADPRDPKMLERINSTVKFRESFRPVAPCVLHDFGNEYFENYTYSPFMERTFSVRPEIANQIPAVVHIDQTARVQSVTEESNLFLYTILQEFYRITGIPMLINTSLNVMGKPIVHSAEEAISVLATTNLDGLLINNVFFGK